MESALAEKKNKKKKTRGWGNKSPAEKDKFPLLSDLDHFRKRGGGKCDGQHRSDPSAAALLWPLATVFMHWLQNGQTRQTARQTDRWIFKKCHQTTEVYEHQIVKRGVNEKKKNTVWIM